MAFWEVCKVTIMEKCANNLWMFFHSRQDRTWGKWFENDVEEAPWETKTSTCKMSRSLWGWDWTLSISLLPVSCEVQGISGWQNDGAFLCVCNRPSTLYRNLYLIISEYIELRFMLTCLEGFCNFSDVFWRDKILDFGVRRLPYFYCSKWL